MLVYLRSKPNFVDLLMRHISTPAIVDVLVKLFTLIETAQNETRNALIDVCFVVIRLLVCRFLASYDTNTISF